MYEMALLILALFFVLYELYKQVYREGFHEEDKIFPFRYFADENDRPLPFVAVTGFFRDKEAKERYEEYKQKGLHIFGITAYKTFPNKHKLDDSEGTFEREDDFDYTGNIKNWLCCFKNKGAKPDTSRSLEKSKCIKHGCCMLF
jgi:hypothetical protein